MAASRGYYAALASVLDEPAPPDGIGEACDSRAPRLITGASAIEEMAMGGGAAPPPPRGREMHPLGRARAMRAPLAHSFERSDVPPAPRSLGEVIGVYAWGREIIEDAEDGEEGEEGEECGETFMVIDEEVVRPPPTPQRPLPTRTTHDEPHSRTVRGCCCSVWRPRRTPLGAIERGARALYARIFCVKNACLRAELRCLPQAGAEAGSASPPQVRAHGPPVCAVFPLLPLSAAVIEHVHRGRTVKTRRSVSNL